MNLKIHNYTHSECVSIAATYLHLAFTARKMATREYYAGLTEAWFSYAKIAQKQGHFQTLAGCLEVIKN